MKDWQAAIVLFGVMAGISIVPQCSEAGGILHQPGAADPWSKQDVAMEVAYQVMNLLDAGTTAAIGDSPHYTEVGPAKYFVGNNPGEVETAAFFTLTGLLHVGVTHYLPAKYRPYWQGVTVTIQTGYVLNNYQLGLRWGF